MTIIMYPSTDFPWNVERFRIDENGVEESIGVWETETHGGEIHSGIRVAGEENVVHAPSESKIITNIDEVLKVTLTDFKTTQACEVWSTPTEPFSIADYKTMMMFIKTSIPPSLFEEYYFFLEDSLNNRRKYALKNDMVGKFRASDAKIYAEDEDFNASFIVKFGFVFKTPTADIANFQFHLLELSMSELRIPQYCKPEDVVRFMGLLDNSGRPFRLTQESMPSYEDICNHIIEAEDFIDAQTRTSFRVNRVEGEIHDEPFGLNLLGATNRGMMGAFNLPALTSLYGGNIFTGVPVSLVRRDVLTIDYSLGDKVEVRRIGTIWVEVGEDKVWQDHQKGIIWIKDYIHMRDSSVRVTYRWGRDKVPADIVKCCKLQAATQIISTDWYRANFPVTEDISPNKMDVVNTWTWQIKDILKGYQTQISVGAV